MSPISPRQLTPGYARRYSNTAHTPHMGFSAGMNRDIASWEAPEGSVYDASDMLCDAPGKIRKRGGTTSPSASNRVAVVENLLAYKSAGYDAITGLFGSSGKTSAIVSIFDKTTGAATALATGSSFAYSPSLAGRPFQHANYACFPFLPIGVTAGSGNGILMAGGGTGANLQITAATVTGGDNRVTGITLSSGTLAATHVGSFISLYQTSGSSRRYIGRIVEFTSSSAIRVEPTPTISMTAVFGSSYIQSVWPNLFSNETVGAAFGVSYQGRMVLGRTLQIYPPNIAEGTDIKANRVLWSQLQTEPVPDLAALGLASADGDPLLYGSYPWTGTVGSIPYYNWVDIPQLEGMTGLAVAGEGQLVIFGPRKVFRIEGNLSTETAADPTFSFNVVQIASNVGILAPRSGSLGDQPSRSIQYTRNGLIFCGSDNLYLYDGARVRGLLDNKNSNYLQQRLRAGDAIYGSAYSLNTNHYYLSMGGTDGGLMFDLDAMAMTRMTGPTTQLFDAVPDPADATILWGARWWDTTTTAPTMTKGQLVRLDPIWLPASTNKSDADGTAVLPTIRTKSYPEGDLAATKRFTQVGLEYDLRAATGTPTVTVSADTELNAADAAYVTGATPWTLPVTGATAAEKAFWILPTLAKGPAIEFRIVLNAICDTFELNSLTIGVQDQRVGR